MMTMPRNVEGGNESKTERKSNAGRKSKYYTHIEPYLEAIAAMRRNGISQEQIAEKFGVNPTTLIDYKHKFPNFADVLKENAEVADFAVENALFKSATTGNLGAQIFWLKNRASKKWRDKQHVFQTSTVTQRKDYENMTDDELEIEMEQLENIVPEIDYENEGEVH